MIFFGVFVSCKVLRRGGGQASLSVKSLFCSESPFFMFRAFRCKGSSEGAFRSRRAAAGRGEAFGSFIVKLFKRDPMGVMY